MILLIAREPLSSILRWVQGLLFFLAAAAISYSTLVYTGAWIFQRHESQPTHHWPTQPAASLPDSGDGTLARLDIDRLELSVMVIEGVSAFDLSHAAGHIPGTALPGQGRNIGISAHRDTYFRPLRDIRPGDIATLTTRGARHRYRVASTRVVAPSDVSVLAPGVSEALTLITCHPFDFVGPAPHRFVVRAERI